MTPTISLSLIARESKQMFQKGNKFGGQRSKIQCDFEKKCREFMEKEGWDGLVKLARNPKTQTFALVEMMNRGFGKPKESLDVTNREAESNPESLEAEITELIAGGIAKGDTASQPGQGTA